MNDPAVASAKRARITRLVEKPGLCELLLVILAALPFLGSLHGPWILDDNMLIAQNPLVRDPSHWARLWSSEYWSSTGAQTSLFRPLPMTSYALTWWAFGNSTLPFHMTNIALHCVVTLLVWRLGSGGARTVPALLMAALFATHPIHVEAVANVVGRSEILLALGFLCMLAAHRGLVKNADGVYTPRVLGAKDFAWMLAIAVACACMLFSKETALALVFFPLIDDAACRRLRLPERRKRAISAYVTLVAVTLFYLVMRQRAVVGATLGPQLATVWERLALTTSAVLKNSQLLLLPIQQRAVWPLPSLAAIHPIIVVAGTALLALVLGLLLHPVFWAFQKSDRKPIEASDSCNSFSVAVALAAIALPLLPLLHVVPNVIWVWERGLYVPSIGLCWVVYCGLIRLRDSRAGATLTACLYLVVAVAAFRAAYLDRLYADDLRFWRYQYSMDSRSVPAALSLSESLLKRGQTDAAIRYREQAYQLDPSRGPVVAALAALYFQSDRFTEAGETLTSASLADLTFHTARQRQQTLRMLQRMADELKIPDVARRFSDTAQQPASKP
jgi:protein O-mannosyl-transferase